MKNLLSTIIVACLSLVIQTVVVPKLALVVEEIFILRFLFSAFYVNTIVIVLSYLALTRKPYEALMWSLFLYSLTNAFGLAWGSSLSLAYILITVLCLASRQSIFISGYVQKFVLCFVIYFIVFLFEHWFGGMFQRKSSMLLGTFSSLVGQCILYSVIAPFVLDMMVWLDYRTLSKIELQEKNLVFARQREGLIATF